MDEPELRNREQRKPAEEEPTSAAEQDQGGANRPYDRSELSRVHRRIKRECCLP